MSIKKAVSLLYIITIIVLASATYFEHIKGTPFAVEYIYGSWWFCLLWTMLAAGGMVYIVQQRVKKWNIVLLHVSFVLILTGALLTHLLAFKGVMHLRVGETSNKYMVSKTMETTEEETLPFAVRLDKFEIDYHPGSQAVKDYKSHFTIIDGEKQTKAQISMNKIFEYQSVRFNQNSYDTDSHGSYISLNSDPYGISVTYFGYALLFFSLIWLLIDPKGTFRHLLKSDLLKKGILSVALLGAMAYPASAATAIPLQTAEKFSNLFINYNNRICPVQTFAIDFTKKLYGKKQYNNLTPEQVLMSWIFFPEEWNKEPIIRLKNGEMRSRLQLPEYTGEEAFFRNGEYILGQYLREYEEGQKDAFHDACLQIDDKLKLIMTLQDGSMLTMFPYTGRHGNTVWLSPADRMPADLQKMDVLFIKNLFPLLYGQLLERQYENVNHILDKTLEYQKKHAGNSLPSERQITAEKLYNKVPFATILFMVNLTMGFIALLLTVYNLSKKGKAGYMEPARKVLLVILALSFLALTLCLALRWIISGNIPMSNGYETMLITAWFVMLFTFIAYARAKIMLVFGFLLSGFFLLVSHIGQMDPAIGHIMPVLNSPLLSIHVSIIMMSYALLALTFICGLTGIVLHIIRGTRADEELQALQVLSGIFLYPALTTMGLGIFIGAIWANVSWGRYWSWDPKETWALITFMLYAVVVHTHSLPVFKKPLTYHIYLTAAFLSILMTYFGVNYV